MAKLTGVVIIRIGGDVMRSEPGAKLKLGGKNREMKSGHKVNGHVESVEPSECEFTVAHASGDDATKWNDIVDQELEFECDSGQTYLVKNACCTDPPELSDNGGGVALKFAGDPALLM